MPARLLQADVQLTCATFVAPISCRSCLHGSVSQSHWHESLWLQERHGQPAVHMCNQTFA